MDFIRKVRSVPRRFLYEKAIKTDIYAVRFALIALFSEKNEIFSSMDRVFYKNAQIYTLARFALTLYFVIDLFLDGHGMVRAFEINQSNAKMILILNTERFALLTLLAEKR
jgi:hypothetical protein